jgi:hypothetical protein
MSVLPFDLTEIIHEELKRGNRVNDFLLHASSDISGPLRHTQLSVAGAPKIGEDLVRQMALWIGTELHERIHDMLRRIGVPYMAEVNLNPWLPRGWGGTADAVIWHPEVKAFVLTDFKTTKGESIRYILRDGAKAEHQAQTSAYWHALKKMGIPLAKVIGVYYLPKNEVRSKTEAVYPVLADFEPLPAKDLHATMRGRTNAVDKYRASLPEKEPGDFRIEDWLTDDLAPVQSREQRVYYDRATGMYELKLVPHWTAGFCPFPDDLCDCSTQGTTKLGVFDTDGTYHPRVGFEDVEPTTFPS